MRVGLIVAGGFDRSGREHVIPALLWLVERLARRDEVHVFVLQYHAEPCAYPLVGATVHDLGRPRGWAGGARALVAAMRGVGRFDIVHGYWATPPGLAAVIAGRRLRVPSVVTLDSGELVSLPDLAYGLQRTWRGRLAVRLACRLASRVTVCSEYMRDLARLYGLQVDVVPLGVDPRWFAPAARPPDRPPWRLLQMASLKRVKDQATLIEAVGRLRARGLDIELDLVGEDTLGGALQQTAAARRLAQVVRFHGFQPTDRLRGYVERAHLYVQSSRHEAAGVAVLEAAAAGVPIVGTTVGYVRDWDGVRAAGVPPGHADALAEAIVTLIESPARRRRLAEGARAWALQHDADWTAGQVEQIYSECSRHHTCGTGL